MGDRTVRTPADTATFRPSSGEPLPAPRPPSPLAATLRSLSDRLVDAQRPLRILEAVRWGPDVEHAFFASGGRELPPVSRDYYLQRPLPFDPRRTRLELLGIERDVRRTVGKVHPAGQVLLRMCAECRQVVDLLVCRGTPEFARLSRRLYGHSADRLHAGSSTLSDLGRMLSGMADNLPGSFPAGPEPVLDAAQAVRALSDRLAGFFGGSAGVRVRVSDGIVSDAAAGRDYIKVRGGARFTPREVRLLEVHEGWVHLGTALNGQRQPVCTFLARGGPSSTLTQEGLAVLTELLAFASHPGRVRRLAGRVEGVALAERGADFREVYRFFLGGGYAPGDAYQHAVRVFRGSLPAGCGPFTKDLCYSKGLALVYHFMRLAVRRGKAGLIPLLFCGKTHLGDVKLLAELVEEGLVAPPRYLPPPFADLHGLCAWLCYANFLGQASAGRVERELGGLF